MTFRIYTSTKKNSRFFCYFLLKLFILKKRLFGTPLKETNTFFGKKNCGFVDSEFVKMFLEHNLYLDRLIDIIIFFIFKFSSFIFKTVFARSSFHENKVSFTNLFQASPCWYQLKDLVFIKWKKNYVSKMNGFYHFASF